jgi:hypothetical protein
VATRHRATFLLQLLIVVGTIGSLMALWALLDGVPRLLATVVLVASLVALELEVLPTLIEWWVLRWAARHSGPLRSAWFVDADAEEGQARRERLRDVEDDPTA